MLWNLKRKIYDVYGPQWKFAIHVKEPETFISHVIHNRRELPKKKKGKWAKALNCSVKDLFGE